MNSFVIFYLFCIAFILVTILIIIISFKKNKLQTLAYICTTLSTIFMFAIIFIPCNYKYINVEYQIDKDVVDKINFNNSQMQIRIKDSKKSNIITHEYEIEFSGDIKYEIGTNDKYVIMAKKPIYMYLRDLLTNNNFDNIQKESEKEELKDVNLLRDIIIYEPSNE